MSFIVFEGGDGVGKSTQVQLLADALAAEGRDVVVTRQPGGTQLGTSLRQLLLDPAADVDARAEALIYAADKAQHVHELIRPALAAGQVVICDRYVDSMIAYQGAGRVLDLDDVVRIAAWATDGLVPDLTIVLDADPAVGLGRITATKDRLESAGEEFHQRARQHFLHLASQDPSRYAVIDAMQAPQEIHHQIWQLVSRIWAS